MLTHVKQRLQRLLRDPNLWEWLPSGLLGGLSGGAAVAWLLWGAPKLLTAQICFVFVVPLLVGTYFLVTALGITLVMLTRRTVKAIRRIRTPAAIAMWEPPEPMVELDAFGWPHPGCGIAMYLPLILISAAGSLVWFYLGFWQVPFWRMVAAMVLGLPLAIRMARGEARVWRRNDQTLSR